MTSYRVTDTWLGQTCETLADILEPGLVCVFVGLNPSVVSVQKGHYLQGVLGQQFWRLLITYGILPEPKKGAFVDDTLLANEFGITDVADPLGGSWYVEHLTDRLEADARLLMDEVERMGGAVAAIEQGYVQQAIADEAYRKQGRIASGEDVVVGVNAFQDESAPSPEP